MMHQIRFLLMCAALFFGIPFVLFIVGDTLSDLAPSDASPIRFLMPLLLAIAAWFILPPLWRGFFAFLRGLRHRKSRLPAQRAGRKAAKPPTVRSVGNPLQEAPRELSDDLRDYINEAYRGRF